MRRLSIRSCLKIRQRGAPKASRSAISLQRDAPRASIRPAMLAVARTRIIPTAAIKTNSGSENWWRREPRPWASSGNSMRGASSGLKMASGPVVALGAKTAVMADSAWALVTSGFRRATISVQTLFGMSHRKRPGSSVGCDASGNQMSSGMPASRPLNPRATTPTMLTDTPSSETNLPMIEGSPPSWFRQ